MLQTREAFIYRHNICVQILFLIIFTDCHSVSAVKVCHFQLSCVTVKYIDAIGYIYIYIVQQAA